MKKELIMGAAIAALAGTMAQGAGEWAEKVTVKGDLRYRYEMIDEEGKDTRQRDRVRARLGVEGNVNSSVKAGIGLSSGEKDPVSSNQTLTDGFGRKNIMLELAYVDWKLNDTFGLAAGKIKNPFTSVSDLVWDGDLNPEGLAVSAKGGTEQVELGANAGYLWVQERSGESDDTMLYVGRASAKINFSPELYVLVGGGYYDYERMEGNTPVDFAGKGASYGNSTRKVVKGGVTNTVYANDYNLLEGFVQARYWNVIPYTVFGHYAVNTEADAFDTAYQVGFGIGKAKNPQTMEFTYAYVEIEKDAVVGAFTDSDRFGGGTDGDGHKFGLKYQAMKNVQLAATYFMNSKTISDSAKERDYDRLQLDLIANF